MKRTIYLIREYNLIEKTLFSYELLGDFAENEVKVKDGKIISAGIYETNSYFYLSEKPKGIKYEEEGLMPYFADLTEDIPGGYSFKPKVYKNAQLMMNKRGSYILFKHKDKKHEMPIAINSYTYKPINLKVKTVYGKGVTTGIEEETGKMLIKITEPNTTGKKWIALHNDDLGAFNQEEINYIK